MENSGSMNTLKKVREFFWPILDSDDDVKVESINQNDCKFSNSDLDLELEYIEKRKESEENRKKQVESKAIIFIGTFGVATMILINLAKELIVNSDIKTTGFNLLVMASICVTIVYLCRSILFAIKTLERKKYFVLGFPKFMLTDCDDKKKKIFIEQYNNIENNSKVINEKVDYMTMAQLYFKRAIWSVLGLTIILFLTSCIVYFCDFNKVEGVWRLWSKTVAEVPMYIWLVVNIAIMVIFFSIIITILKKIQKELNILKNRKQENSEN